MSEQTTHDTATTDADLEAERVLPLVVLGEVIIMPRIPVPLQIGQGKSFRALERAMEGDREVLLIAVPESEIRSI